MEFETARREVGKDNAMNPVYDEDILVLDTEDVAFFYRANEDGTVKYITRWGIGVIMQNTDPLLEKDFGPEYANKIRNQMTMDRLHKVTKRMATVVEHLTQHPGRFLCLGGTLEAPVLWSGDASKRFADDFIALFGSDSVQDELE